MGTTPVRASNLEIRDTIPVSRFSTEMAFLCAESATGPQNCAALRRSADGGGVVADPEATPRHLLSFVSEMGVIVGRVIPFRRIERLNQPGAEFVLF